MKSVEIAQLKCKHDGREPRPHGELCGLLGALTAATALMFIPSSSAFAHIIQEEAGGFGAGFEHPLTGADHFLAMFAVGIWGAQMGGRAVWALPVTFPLIMAMGGLAGMLGMPLPHVELGIALSILALGSAIAFGWHPAEAIALILIGAFAICHGYAHGVELPNAADPADYAAGFVIATGMIHLLGVGVGLALNKPVEGRLSRALGAVIAAGGVYFLVV
jgi:urease accessory protein